MQMLKELKCGEEAEYEDNPALVAMVARLGTVYMLVEKKPAKHIKYFWYNVEYLDCDAKGAPRFSMSSPWYSMATKCFTWKGAVDYMRNIGAVRDLGAVIYMYDTMDDVTQLEADTRRRQFDKS